MRPYTFDLGWMEVSASSGPQSLAASTVLLYSGEPDEPLSPLAYLDSRCYCPSVGKFTSYDIAEGEAADPASLQRYQYAVGSPIKAVDAAERCEAA